VDISFLDTRPGPIDAPLYGKARERFVLTLQGWQATEQPRVDVLDRDKLFDLMNGRALPGPTSCRLTDTLSSVPRAGRSHRVLGVLPAAGTADAPRDMHMKDRRMSHRSLALVVVGALALALSGCSEEPATETPAASPPVAKPTDAGPAPPADTGTIEVRVTYAGAPVVETIPVNKDVEQCGTEARIEKVVVGDDHGLRWAVASVVGLEGPPTARTPQLDQRGCQFRPHVVAMQPGELEILNSDGVLHNIHTYSEANAAINKAQPKFKKVMTETFTKPEMIRVTCDVHSWMNGWIAVLPHPYFGVTDPRGITRVEGVPAGAHTVEVWHAQLGRRTADVTVKAGETAAIAVEFPKADSP
jgi:plastocyanin